MRPNQRSKKSNDETAGDIDDDCAPWKCLAKAIGDQTGDPITRHTTDGAADRYQNIIEHKKTYRRIFSVSVGVISSEFIRQFSFSGRQTPLPEAMLRGPVATASFFQNIVIAGGTLEIAAALNYSRPLRLKAARPPCEISRSRFCSPRVLPSSRHKA